MVLDVESIYCKTIIDSGSQIFLIFEVEKPKKKEKEKDIRVITDNHFRSLTLTGVTGPNRPPHRKKNKKSKLLYKLCHIGFIMKLYFNYIFNDL